MTPLLTRQRNNLISRRGNIAQLCQSAIHAQERAIMTLYPPVRQSPNSNARSASCLVGTRYRIRHIFYGHAHAHWRGGGAKNAHPSGFSRIAEKRRRAAPPFFQYLLTIEFDTLCKNFSPRSPKVRSPGQVKVKNGFLTLRLRSGHTRYPIGFKPSAFHKVIDTYNLYISDFLYLSPEVRSIS